MGGYSKIERIIAKVLENFPLLRIVVKESYKRLTYVFYRKRGFQFRLQPLVKLQSAFEWARIEPIPGEYFYGYYDKSPWSDDMQKMLLHHWQKGKLEVIVLEKGKAAPAKLGTTLSWNWQQGAMAQWATIDQEQEQCVVFNVINEGILGMKIIRPGSTYEQFIPWPIQALSPRKPEALSINYKRLFLIRDCYGYAPEVNNFTGKMDAEKDGVWRINLKTGIGHLIISLKQLMGLHPVPEMFEADHKVNHLIYSSNGERFVFLHRYYNPQGRFSRLYAANNDGSCLKLLLNARMVSHYHWLDDDTLVAWARTHEHGDKYYRVNATNGDISIIGENVLEHFGDGHCSVSTDGRFLLTDTYPDKARNQRLVIYDLEKNKSHLVGTFFTPWNYYEYNRCDLHPRWSQDNNFISIDSTHSGKRQSYVLSMKEFLDSIG
ncbi:MAG: hypothetical protein KKE17_08805 [Proteobacteria bacterium]|nr:hypothetical protein [Pseudomonadota bacterium]MBU1710087.1 hypothetical protein [Pseudomonadota bacterium]